MGHTGDYVGGVHDHPCLPAAAAASITSGSTSSLKSLLITSLTTWRHTCM